MAESSKREISGFFLSADKFASHVAALASAGCAITHLRLFHNEPHHSAAVIDALGRNTSVTNVDIFELDPSAANALAAVLAASPRLTALAVHHPQSHDAVLNLCRGISASRTLSRIHLSQLDPRGVTALANALLSWATPRTPDPDGAAPSDDPLAPPGDDSSSHPPRLQHLRLDRCSFNMAAAASLAEALGRQAGALTQLEIVESDLADAAAEALMAAPGWARLAWAGALDSLDLSTNHIGPKGAAQLGRFLESSDGLHSLSLANNKTIGCEGARALAAGLAANRTLLRLDLTGCGVATTGVAALAAALRSAAGPDADGAAAAAAGPILEHLLLGENAAGAAGLAELMLSTSGPRPCALQLLQLNHNHIRGTELPEALSRAAAEAPQAVKLTAPLRELSLAGNALYDAGVKLLAEALTEAPCLEQLDLRENGISDAGVAALLPLVAPAGPRRGSAGGAGRDAGAAAGRESGGGAAPQAGSSRGGLQGLLLDGNRLHNAGAQALLDAVTAAPGLWKFSVEGNKLTDPALRLSLSQLSQLRAARHSQLVVLGRHYSSSSASTSEDGTGSGGEGQQRRGSGGGGGGRKSQEALSPMDVDGGAAHHGRVRPPPPGAAGRAAGQHHHHPQQQPQQQHKHRLEEPEAAAGQAGGGEDRQPLRKVAARSEDGALHGGGGGAASGGGSACAMQMSAGGRQAWSGMPPAHGGTAGCGGEAGGGGGGGWSDGCVVPSCDGGAPDCRSRSSGGGSSADCASCGDANMLGAESDGRSSSGGGGRHNAGPNSSGGALPYCASPPATCFVTALTGVGGATSVGVSKRVGGGVESDQQRYYSPAPQQLLPACRRPRYKPLTPEQQRLFEDF